MILVRRIAAYQAAADALARLVADLLDVRDDAWKHSTEVIKEALWAFHYTAGELDRSETIEIPTPRREVPLVVRQRVLERDGCCLNCGAVDDLVIDHVVPLVLGGRHAEENFQTLCSGCNGSKGVAALDYRLDRDSA